MHASVWINDFAEHHHWIGPHWKNKWNWHMAMYRYMLCVLSKSAIAWPTSSTITTLKNCEMRSIVCYFDMFLNQPNLFSMLWSCGYMIPEKIIQGSHALFWTIRYRICYQSQPSVYFVVFKGASPHLCPHFAILTLQFLPSLLSRVSSGAELLLILPTRFLE